LTNLVTAAGITNTITVVSSMPIYTLIATNLSTVIAFDVSGLDLSSKVATWETMVTVANTNVSVAYPPTNTVYYLATPVLTTTANNQTHYAVWRAFVLNGVTNIFCNQWLTK
jgi:hypothetical protein